MKFWSGKKQSLVLPPLEGYNRWAASYRQESNPIKNLSDELIEKFLPPLQGHSVLDAGCGPGKFCESAERQRASRIVGLDLSPAMLEIARQHCKSGDFRTVELSNWQPTESFDVIICALVLGHLESLSPALDNLIASMKPGGLLLITDFHPFLTLQQSKRTFKDVPSGKSVEIRHYLHMFQDYFRIFQEKDAKVETMLEPTYNNFPAVFGMKVRKS